MDPLLKKPNSGVYNVQRGNNNYRRAPSYISPEREEIAEIIKKKSRQLVYVYSTLLFGICALLLIVGILYLSVFFYRWSFIEFSTTICAALFVSLGGTLLIIVALNGWMVRNQRTQFVMLTPVVAIAFFATLLGIGIWGLVVSYDDRLSDEVSARERERVKQPINTFIKPAVLLKFPDY